MIIRQVATDQVVLISQEGHADVAAQFGAHWGGNGFARLDPYESMLFGIVYHDSGHREMEATLAVNPETGLPYNFRGAPPEVRDREADARNSLWIRQRDPYAALIVSMHHSGLRKRRYDTIRVRSNGAPPPSTEQPLGARDALADLQGWQRDTAGELGLSDPGRLGAFWHNYQMLQVYDLLSLHFCCDGYEGQELRPIVLERVPTAPNSGKLADIAIEPAGPNTARFSPYPFDMAPLQISVMARAMSPCQGRPEVAVREAYYQAPRRALTWQLVN